jgi:hypothetical protein
MSCMHGVTRGIEWIGRNVVMWHDVIWGEMTCQLDTWHDANLTWMPDNGHGARIRGDDRRYLSRPHNATLPHIASLALHRPRRPRQRAPLRRRDTFPTLRPPVAPSFPHPRPVSTPLQTTNSSPARRALARKPLQGTGRCMTTPALRPGVAKAPLG